MNIFDILVTFAMLLRIATVAKNARANARTVSDGIQYGVALSLAFAMFVGCFFWL